MEHDKWMSLALAEAQKAFDEGEVPIGAVVVENGRIVGKGHNMTQALNDVTAHAEMIAITAAQTAVGKYLDRCTLYVTVEPCLMCAGAIGWSQLKTIVFGAEDPKKGYSTFTAPSRSPFHPKATVIRGVMERECGEILQRFFAMKRSL